jgi:hypothetical protein
MTEGRSRRRRHDLHGGDRSVAQLIDVVDHLIDEDITRRKVANDLGDLNVDATVGKLGDTTCLHLGVHRLPLVRPVRPDGIVARDTSATTHVGPIDIRRHVDKQRVNVPRVEAVIDGTEEELVIHPHRMADEGRAERQLWRVGTPARARGFGTYGSGGNRAELGS